MDSLVVHESCLCLAASARNEDDLGWLALESVINDWPGWLNPVNPDHDDAATSNTSPPMSPPPPLSQTTPVLLSVAHITEDYADLPGLMSPTAPAAANSSCHATSKGEKHLRPRELTILLRSWLERRQSPYASLEEKKFVAASLSISVGKVTNFCNNFRKRFVKVGDKLTSYRELASAAQ